MRVFAVVLSAMLMALNVASGLTAATPTAEEPLNLVVIGDSVPFARFCTTCDQAFVEDYAARLEAETGRKVHVMNRSRNDGAQLDQIAEQVATESTLREQLTTADIVIVSAGINDGPPWAQNHPCGAYYEDETRAFIDQMLTYTHECLDQEVASRADDYRGLFTSLKELVPAGTPVVILNVYNSWTGWPEMTAHATPAELARVDESLNWFLTGWNKQECALAAEYGFICLDLHHAFNGPDGTTPAGDLLEVDYSHPNNKGNALIADLLVAANLLGERPATPEAAATPRSMQYGPHGRQAPVK